MRRLGSPWTLERETTSLEVNGRTFFPDFTLARGEDRVLVEIVGFYTPECLSSKRAALRAAGGLHVVHALKDATTCVPSDTKWKVSGPDLDGEGLLAVVVLDAGVVVVPVL